MLILYLINILESKLIVKKVNGIQFYEVSNLLSVIMWMVERCHNN